MKNKEKNKFLLENLLKDPLFRESLGMVSSDEERRKIKAFAEDFLLNIVEGFESMKKTAEENSEKLAEALKNHIDKK
jgi:hypothetical protein